MSGLWTRLDRSDCRGPSPDAVDFAWRRVGRCPQPYALSHGGCIRSETAVEHSCLSPFSGRLGFLPSTWVSSVVSNVMGAACHGFGGCKVMEVSAC